MYFFECKIKILFEGKDDSVPHYTNIIKQNKINNRNKYVNTKNNYNDYAYKNKKKKTKNNILLNLLKYIIILILLNPSISNLNIILTIKPSYNYEKILYIGNIGIPNYDRSNNN